MAMSVPAMAEALNQLARLHHSMMVEKGFWDEGVPSCLESIGEVHLIGMRLAQIAGEAVHEALEEIRKPEPDRRKFAEELADVVLRVVDLAEASVPDHPIGDILRAKMEKNAQRPRLHGKRF